MPASRIQGKKAQTASGLEAPPDFTPDRLRELQPEWLLQLVKKAKQNYASILEQHTSTKVYAADLYLQSPDIYESTDEVNIRTLTSLQFGALFTELLPKCGFDVKFRAGTSVLGGTTKVDEGIFLEGQRNFLPFECKDAEELKVQPTYSISDILKDPSTRSRIGRPALQTVSCCVREGAKFAVCYDGQCCILFKRHHDSVRKGMGVAVLSVTQTNPSLREVLFAAALSACSSAKLDSDFAIVTPDNHKWLKNHNLSYHERADSATLSYRAHEADNGNDEEGADDSDPGGNDGDDDNDGGNDDNDGGETADGHDDAMPGAKRKPPPPYFLRSAGSAPPAATPKRMRRAEQRVPIGTKAPQFDVQPCQHSDVQLGKCLGSGSSGAWVLEGSIAGQAAAVKVWELYNEPASACSPQDEDAPRLASFYREAEALTHLASKQVAAAPALLKIGCFAAGNEPFIATQRLGVAVEEWEDLHQHQQEAIAALQQLHAVGVLHGDISPGAFHWAGPAGASQLKIIDYDGAALGAAPELLRQELQELSFFLTLPAQS